MSKLSKSTYFLITFLFFTFFDFYAANFILINRFALPENPVFNLTFVQNDGAAFNILQNSRFFLIIFSVAALIYILFFTIKHMEKISVFGIFCISMLSSGIFCNMCERIIFGYVRDYIILNFVDFPVFNISDIFINISVFILVIIIIKSNYLKKT